MSFRRMLYSILLYLILPIVLFRLFWRGRSNPAYRQRISERFGFVNIDNTAPIIWVHAVSVGETIAAKPLIEALITQYPDHRVLVTTTTPTGSDRVKALFGERVAHVYFPYDLPDVIARFIKRIKPAMLLVIETEIWPNLYAKCQREKIPLLLVNARLSQRSTEKYLKIKGLVSETLSKLSLIAVRSAVDATRFTLLGASDQQLFISGNIKFDLKVDDAHVKKGKQWRKQWEKTANKDLKVIVAASTHAGEDQQLLAIYQNVLKQFPDLLLVLVPRHPERFDEVFLLCAALKTHGVKTIRHSLVKNDNKAYEATQMNIIVADSMGEMQSWFATADVVFMGGSLVETGGHNPLEPIAQGVPVVSGPHMFNFDDIAEPLSNEDLLFICKTATEVETKIAGLLIKQGNDFEETTKVFMQQHRGVVARLIKQITTFL